MVIALALAAMLGPETAQGAVSGLVCTSTSVQAVLRTEGLTERAGEMVFNCTGDTPGGEVGASFSVFLSVPVTNRLGGDGMTDATLTVDAGPGTVPVTVRGRLVGSNAVIFEYVNWTLTSFAVSTIKIANIRVNASGAANRAITALVSTNGISRIVTNQPNLAVGITQPGLLASASTADEFKNNGRVILLFVNGNASSRTLTIAANDATKPGFGTNGGRRVAGPWPVDRFNDSDGHVNYTLDAATGMTVAAIRLANDA